MPRTPWEEGDDEPGGTVTVCAGPPKCLLEGDEAVKQAQNGCPICLRIFVRPDGTEEEYRIKSH